MEQLDPKIESLEKKIDELQRSINKLIKIDNQKGSSSFYVMGMTILALVTIFYYLGLFQK